jgi:diacylglycerol kinase family enzyme
MGNAVQIVVTQGSGNGVALRQAGRVQRALAAAGYAARLRSFGRIGELRRWAKTCDHTFSHLIVVGGDATLSEAAMASIRLSVPLVAVPSGFGNLFARALHGRPDADGVVDLLTRGEHVSIDAGVAPGGIFLSHQSYGVLAEIQEATERVDRRPRQRYLRLLAYYRAAARWLRRASLRGIDVEVDGHLVARDAGLVTVANVETYRGFLTLTPGASPVDGLLDVCVIPRTSPARILARLVALMLGIPRAWDGMGLHQGQRIRIRQDDGRVEDVRVLTGALPVLVSSGARAALSPRRGEELVPVARAVARAVGGGAAFSGRRSPARLAPASGSGRSRAHPGRSTPPAGSVSRG